MECFSCSGSVFAVGLYKYEDAANCGLYIVD